MKDALERIASISQDTSGTGLTANIARLQQSVPELQSGNKTAAPQIITVESALSSGVTSQGSVLIDLLETRHDLQTLLQLNDALRQQATNVRAPMSSVLRSLIAEGQQLSQEAEAPAPQGNQPQQTPPVDLNAITGRFKALAAAAVPLSQELIVIEQSRANLVAWQTSVTNEYNRILHSLLVRIVVIAIALGIILGSGEIWTRATNKYIRDIRRRRQLLIVRRVAVGFLSVIVVLFGFVTQFNSLATFAGFITAGIAVGLQTILLSVAAYFFIIGRYGIKVGDRITIATVTGDVIEVGLVRFYVMELAGSSTELNPTGRIAVFSNAVLFQAGTPLFKQLPGTGYAWHELIVKLTDSADYHTVCEAIVHLVETAYKEYRDRIVHEHNSVQNWMQTSIDSPEIQSRLQFSAGVFQFWVRFPVEIRSAAQTDEEITRALLDLMATNPAMKSAIAAVPTIQASVRG
jgi:small-conductance mechanosensitive channel